MGRSITDPRAAHCQPALIASPPRSRTANPRPATPIVNSLLEGGRTGAGVNGLGAGRVAPANSP